MQLHLMVNGPTNAESFSKNLKHQEAANFNVSAFLAEHDDAHVRIFGTRKNVKDLVSYKFDSKELERNSSCEGYCEKIVSIERLPFIGLGAEPTNDFTGVIVDRIIEGSAAADSELETGDVITSIENIDISTACELTGAVNDQEVGDYVAVDFIRDGKPNRIFLSMGYRIKKNVTWVPCCEQEDFDVPVQVFEDISLAVYPNPTMGITQFNFKSTSLASAELVLTDMAGQQILAKKVFPLDGQLNDYLDLSRIASGVYLLNIKQEGKIVSEKIVLQRK